jgi:hypothetical protein
VSLLFHVHERCVPAQNKTREENTENRKQKTEKRKEKREKRKEKRVKRKEKREKRKQKRECMEFRSKQRSANVCSAEKIL